MKRGVIAGQKEHMPTIEEVYCKFGFVAEAAQLLETEFSTLLLKEDAMAQDLFDNPNPKRSRDILDKINKKTLGRLISESKSKIDSLDSLSESLSVALNERNRLCHSFYLEHNLRLRSKDDSGRKIMMEDLERMHVAILDAYKSVLLLSGIDLEKMAGSCGEIITDSLPNHLKLL